MAPANRRTYFGSVHPLLGMAAAVVVAFVSLSFLCGRYGLAVYAGERSLHGVVLAAELATMFAGAVILADVIGRFSAGINVPAHLRRIGHRRIEQKGWGLLITIVGWLSIVGGLGRMFAPVLPQDAARPGWVYGLLAVLLALGIFLTWKAYEPGGAETAG